MALETSSVTPACKNCKFFRLDFQDTRQGQCTRFPPQPYLVMTPHGPQSMPAFPNVLVSLSCGEYQTKLSLMS